MDKTKSERDAEKQKKALEKLENEHLMASLQMDEIKLKDLKKKLVKVEGYPERGIETWFRLASRNLYTRRQIVDTKSNILITINSIMVSIIIGSLYPILNDDPHLIYGIVPIILGNTISLIYAILATRPNIGRGSFTDTEIHQKTAALMTFDDFYKMPLETYEMALDKMMESNDFLYSTIKKDLHRLGIGLGREYKNIRTAYNVFLAGLIIGLFSFGICHVIF